MSEEVFTHGDVAPEDGPLEVEVVDDRPAGDIQHDQDALSQRDVDQRDAGNPIEKRINKLKYQYHQERKAKESFQRMQAEAVRYAQQVAKENQDLKGLINEGEKMLIDEVKARTSSDVGHAKDQYKQALDSGDSDAIVDAQEALSFASYDSKKADEYAPAVSREMAAPAAVPRSQPQQQKPDPKAVEWASKNDWFGSDREMTAYAQAVHETLVTDEKVNPSSNDYYQKIDGRMRERFPEKFDESAAEQSAPSRQQEAQRRSSVVAPARRSSGATQNKVQLTATQVALAKRLGVTPEQYARQVLELEKSNV
jgi:hypothetical protein